MNETETWYVVKQESGECTIVPTAPVTPALEQSAPPAKEQWGPYPSQAEAIARRVGLIRAGKCKPV
ncbi:MAG: hypothetical protein NW224_23460 [Leptolyngbyaceae cyanobacterium bins.302]|nr:hypothetical protein [Leptolyngbyaceae cyanobacterium bins.302]